MCSDSGWNIHLGKVKAHTTEEDVANGFITQVDRHGNQRADHWAGMAAAEAQVPESDKNLVDWIDATAWIIQRRLLAVYTKFTVNLV